MAGCSFFKVTNKVRKKYGAWGPHSGGGGCPPLMVALMPSINHLIFCEPHSLPWTQRRLPQRLVSHLFDNIIIIIISLCFAACEAIETCPLEVAV